MFSYPQVSLEYILILLSIFHPLVYTHNEHLLSALIANQQSAIALTIDSLYRLQARQRSIQSRHHSIRLSNSEDARPSIEKRNFDSEHKRENQLAIHNLPIGCHRIITIQEKRCSHHLVEEDVVPLIQALVRRLSQSPSSVLI